MGIWKYIVREEDGGGGKEWEIYSFLQIVSSKEYIYFIGRLQVIAFDHHFRVHCVCVSCICVPFLKGLSSEVSFLFNSCIQLIAFDYHSASHFCLAVLLLFSLSISSTVPFVSLLKVPDLKSSDYYYLLYPLITYNF